MAKISGDVTKTYASQIEMAGDDPVALAAAIATRDNAITAVLMEYNSIITLISGELGTELPTRTPYGDSSDVDDIVASKLGKGK